MGAIKWVLCIHLISSLNLENVRQLQEQRYTILTLSILTLKPQQTVWNVHLANKGKRKVQGVTCRIHSQATRRRQNRQKKKKKKKKKMVSEKFRECHNYKPQPFPDTKRKRKPTNPNKHKSNKRAQSTKISSLFPKRGNRNAKRTEKHKNKMTQGKT